MPTASGRTVKRKRSSVSVYINYALVRMHVQAKYTVVCLCVCVSVYRLLQLLKDESSASTRFYKLLGRGSWISVVDLQNNASFSSYA